MSVWEDLSRTEAIRRDSMRPKRRRSFWCKHTDNHESCDSAPTETEPGWCKCECHDPKVSP